jgi:hypothetical protein
MEYSYVKRKNITEMIIMIVISSRERLTHAEWWRPQAIRGA